MKVVIDSSVIIDFLRKASREKSFARKVIEDEDIVMSLVSVAELYSGKSVQQEGPAKDLLEKILETAEVVYPGFDDAIKVGSLRAKYQLSLGDAFVAALALDLNVPLATLDVSDFKRINGLKVLSEKR